MITPTRKFIATVAASVVLLGGSVVAANARGGVAAPTTPDVPVAPAPVANGGGGGGGGGGKAPAPAPIPVDVKHAGGATHP